MSRAAGLTKARSLGPIAEAIERSGGSAERAFRKAELPFRLVEAPEQLILLRDQMRLLEAGAREIGDDVLPARLSTEAGALGLGALGRICCSRPTLGAAIYASNAAVAATLQSATEHRLTVRDGFAHWTYAVSDPERVGRQKNEMLCLGYRLDLMRRFLGSHWSPSRVTIGGGTLDGRPLLAEVLGSDVALGPGMAIVFRAALLETPNPAALPGDQVRPADEVPDSGDRLRLVEALIALDLLDGLPTLDRLAARLGLSRRSLQRELGTLETRFSSLRDAALNQRARRLLVATHATVTEIALELGYADPAHFTRAFRSWTGASPSRWRKRAA